MNSKLNKIIIHITGCFVLLALPLLYKPDLTMNLGFLKSNGFHRDLFFSTCLILFFYLSYFILVPKLYLNKKYFSFFSITVICFLFIYFSSVLIFPRPLPFQGPSTHIIPKDQFNNRMPSTLGFLLNEFRKISLQFLIVFIFSLMMKINNRWKQTEKEKLDAELSYLKAQINPHFLFNTLNSIYSMAVVKSDDVAAAIVRLSNMMRYVLSESSNQFVILEKEIEYIRNYIELQQIRFGSTIQFECIITGEPKNKMIAPLILIPFIENAYKHGVNAEDNSVIKITINIKESELFLQVKNNKVYIQKSEDLKSGLGVENTKNRLQHIYPAKHSLEINDTEKEYSVSLTLNL